MHMFEEYSNIKEQVIKVLCRKLEKTKDDRKRQAIIKHLSASHSQRETAAAGKLRPPGAATELRLLPRQ